jgi:serine/threonine-protein kinase
MDAPEPEAGTIIAGKYRLRRCLGKGGMASVWAAEHLSLRTEVAVKLIDPRIADQVEAMQRFHREARAAAALRSNHVVRVFDHGVDGDVPYMVMEILLGENLADRLDREKKLTPADTLRVVTHVGRALALAHAEGVVHRDLKPENIFLTKDEESGFVAKILDFGVAKVTGPLAISQRFATRSGVMLGTPWYMSPEQVMGEPTVDEKSDLWALAVITHECLTSRRPFEDQVLARLAEKICREEPLPPSQVASLPFEFDAWFLKALAKPREQRFRSAREMVDGLERALRPAIDGEGRISSENWSDGEGRRDKPTRRISRPSRRVTDPSSAASRGFLRLFLEGMLLCAVTFVVGTAIFLLRRGWDDWSTQKLAASVNPIPFQVAPESSLH